MPPSRPNILFIVVDDCGYADLGCTGQTDYRTPALDRLAAEGIRADRMGFARAWRSLSRAGSSPRWRSLKPKKPDQRCHS